MNKEHNGTGTVRQEFGAMQSAAPIETAGMAIAAQNKAMVEARYVMAIQRPRIWDQVRQDVLKECRRPSFARNKSAYYHKPIGRGVEGLGIRFVEVAIRCMKNMLVETTMIYEDDLKEVHRVSVTDLEGNITYPLDVRVTKTVERQKPAADGSYISIRQNSYGKTVYTIPGTDDDLLNKRAALVSKAIRTLGLRLIPGDIQDEAEQIIKQIRQDETAADPDAEKKTLADAFVQMGVKASELQEYLGHALDACSPAELVSLRGLWGAIRDGEATWAEAFDNNRNLRDEAQAARQSAADDKATTTEEKKTGSKTAGVAEKLKRTAIRKNGANQKPKPKSTEPTSQGAESAQGATPDGAPTVSADDLADRIAAATSLQDLDLIEDLARGLTNAAETKAVQVIIQKRRETLA